MTAFSRRPISCLRQIYRQFSSQELRKTPLYAFHIEHGGKMIDFGGWNLPISYKSDGIMSSHLHTRSHASLFDVSHMGQLRLHGKDRIKFIERLVAGDIQSLSTGEMRLTLFTNENGGIKDDTIITVQDSFISLVVNGACRTKDINHINSHLLLANSEGLDVGMEVLEEDALIALQGPEAMPVLQTLLPLEFNLGKMAFMKSKSCKVGGAGLCTVSRCGYTGEDGFEISVPADKVEGLASEILSNSSVKLAGLGARDTLRLEAAFCLYGHDISEETSPVEASLGWTVGKRRRSDGGFLGADTILHQLKNGVQRKRVGFHISDKTNPKEGATISDKEGNPIGIITSSVFSPTLHRPVAMGYISTAFAKIGTEIDVDVRGKLRNAEVVKMPFVSPAYYELR